MCGHRLCERGHQIRCHLNREHQFRHIAIRVHCRQRVQGCVHRLARCARKHTRRRVEMQPIRQKRHQDISQHPIAAGRSGQRHRVDFHMLLIVLRGHGIREHRHQIRRHRKGERQRGGIPIFIRRNPTVFGQGHRLGWRARNGAFVSVKASGQDRRQRVLQNAIATRRFGQREFPNRPVLHIALRVHRICERRQQILCHHDEETQGRLIPILIGHRQSVARLALWLGWRARHDTAVLFIRCRRGISQSGRRR